MKTPSFCPVSRKCYAQRDQRKHVFTRLSNILIFVWLSLQNYGDVSKNSPTFSWNIGRLSKRWVLLTSSIFFLQNWNWPSAWQHFFTRQRTVWNVRTLPVIPGPFCYEYGLETVKAISDTEICLHAFSANESQTAKKGRSRVFMNASYTTIF